MRDWNALRVRTPEAATTEVDETPVGHDQHRRPTALDTPMTHIEDLLARFQQTREHRHLAARGLARRARQMGRVHMDRIDGEADRLQPYRLKYFLNNHLAVGVRSDRRYASPALRKASA